MTLVAHFFVELCGGRSRREKEQVMKLGRELALHLCEPGKCHFFNASKSFSEFNFLHLGSHAKLDHLIQR